MATYLSIIGKFLEQAEKAGNSCAGLAEIVSFAEETVRLFPTSIRCEPDSRGRKVLVREAFQLGNQNIRGEGIGWHAWMRGGDSYGFRWF
jgi:hypothetical protein